MLSRLVLLGILVSLVRGRSYFSPLGYLRLPAQVTPTETYKLLSGTVEETAYDPSSSLLYVVGSGTKLLHVVDISDYNAPKRLFTYQFKTGDGVPQDVEICGNLLAVSFDSDIPVFDGHVQFFDAFNKQTNSIHYRSRITVGVKPDNIEFTPNCKTLMVANEGSPGVDHLKNYADPEGTISLITFGANGTPIEKFIDFHNFNLREDIRLPGRGIPTAVLPIKTTVPQELEPEYITAIDDNYAYVTFQQNDAIGRINIKSGQADQLFSFTKKDWKSYEIDTSDIDGGIHLRNYPLVSHRLPDCVKSIKLNNKEYLITADEGTSRLYTTSQHGFTFNQGLRARSLKQARKFDEVAITNDTFLTQLGQDSRLGRLSVSTIDGLSKFSGKIEHVHTFGGRGFSIWDPSNFNMVFDSGDHVERSSSIHYPTVFNTDMTSVTTNSAETLKDSYSDDLGPQIDAMDVASDNDENYIVASSKNTGIIYLYTVNVTSDDYVQVYYEHIYRRGSTTDLYSDAYNNNEAGDGYISDVRIIRQDQHPSNETLVVVASEGTGSISLYRIDKDTNPNEPL